MVKKLPKKKENRLRIAMYRLSIESTKKKGGQMIETELERPFVFVCAVSITPKMSSTAISNNHEILAKY